MELPRLARRPLRRDRGERVDERVVEAGALARLAIEAGTTGTRGSERRARVREVGLPGVSITGEPVQPHPREVDVADLVLVDAIEDVGGGIGRASCRERVLCVV